MILPVVGPPRSVMSERQAGWVQGSGARKPSLDGKTVLPPLWGEYYLRSKEPRPRAAIIVVVVVVVVEYYCILIIIIVVGVGLVGSYFRRTVLRSYQKRLFRSRSGAWLQKVRSCGETRRAQQRAKFLWTSSEIWCKLVCYY